MSKTSPGKGRSTRTEIVIALNDSASARAALTWAAAWARRTTWRLRVVHVEQTILEGPPLTNPIASWSGNDARHMQERQRREREVVQAVFDALPPEPGWVLDIARGDIGVELVRASTAAAMLVIGTRRLGPIRRLADGSVSQYCLRHTRCPVLVVPADRPHLAAAVEAPHRDAMARDRQGTQAEAAL